MYPLLHASLHARVTACGHLGAFKRTRHWWMLTSMAPFVCACVGAVVCIPCASACVYACACGAHKSVVMRCRAIACARRRRPSSAIAAEGERREHRRRRAVWTRVRVQFGRGQHQRLQAQDMQGPCECGGQKVCVCRCAATAAAHGPRGSPIGQDLSAASRCACSDACAVHLCYECTEVSPGRCL